MTFHSFVQRDRTVQRNLENLRHDRRIAHDFRRSAWLHFDPQNAVYQANWSHAQDFDAQVKHHEQQIRERIRALVQYIGPQPREWRFGNVAHDTFAVGARKKRFASVGEDMSRALREEDGEYFIEHVWNRLTNYTRLRARLMQHFADETGVDFHHCDHCSTITTDDDDWAGVDDGGGDHETWCPQCVDNDARYSDHMQTWIHSEVAIPFYNSYSGWEDDEADDWVTERWVGRRNHIYLEERGNGHGSCAVGEDTSNMIHDCQRDDSDRDEPDVNSYHSGIRVGHIPSSYDKRKQAVLVGIELEFEFSDNENMHEAVDWVRANDTFNAYCTLEKDGSLTKGFEAITGHTGLDQHETLLAKLLDRDGTLYLNARTDARTNGTHVHVSKLDMTLLHQTKLATFVYAESNRSFIERLAGRRMGGDYCREVDYLYMAKEAGRRHKALKQQCYSNRDAREYVTSDAFGDWSRYGALSVVTSTGRSVEFRMFRGSTDHAEIMAWAEFSFIAWHFAQQLGSTDMTVPKFIQFVYRSDNRADTKYLRKYLQNQMNDEHAIIESRRYKPAKVPREQLSLGVA